MKDGIIELNSEFANKIGFTSNNFEGYLWKTGGYIYISVIESINPRYGNLSALFENIHAKGFGIKVPNPLAAMESIVKRKGFRRTKEYADDDIVDVWVLERKKQNG